MAMDGFMKTHAAMITRSQPLMYPRLPRETAGMAVKLRRVSQANPVSMIFLHPEEYRQSVGGAETFEELFARTAEFLREIVHPMLAGGKDILIVGHGAMNLSMISLVRNLPRKDFWSPAMENCKLIRLI